MIMELKIVTFKEDWPGEWRLFLFGHATKLCFMSPKEWPGFMFSRTKPASDQTHYCLRFLWVDFSWSRFKRKPRV